MTNNPCSEGVKITLESIRSQNEGEEVVLGLLLENGEQREKKFFTLTTDLYVKLKPEKGILTPEQFDLIEGAAELCRAMRCGERLLAYGANSQVMLMRKIMRRGFDRAVAEEAASRLCALGLINEREDMQREIERCAKKLWGGTRIKAQLWTKGYAKDTLAEADGMLSAIPFPENCAKLIEKHYGGIPADPDANRRMLAGLARYGYSSGQIREALQLLKHK